MNYDDEEYSPYAGFGSGCDIHGDNYMRECTMCGIEFCAVCFPNSSLCADCSAQGDDFDEEEEELTTEEERELRLLDEFNDDAPPPEAAAPAPAKPTPAPAARKAKSGRSTLADKSAAKKTAKPSKKRKK
ncbi:MAG: hypothetical protein LBN38_08570 [Verrucomicrobiota bacterium]|jgi:hypothetical protein|nr:hypothetical protein [Verrucomicrobiota bacterium]